MRVILLILIGLSVLNAEITRDSNGIVTDTSTKLQWQDNEVGSTMVWETAISHCEGLDLDGTGWRLPNINELKSIIEKSKVNPAIIDGFVNTISDHYWSSTTNENSEFMAWRGDFNNGTSHGGSKNHDYCYVRCVRGGQ